MEKLNTEIPYAGKSKFLEPLIISFKDQLDLLRNGHLIECDLKTKAAGYKGNMLIEITGCGTHFRTNWQSSDITRFPARLKATATALLKVNALGYFEICHDKGLVVVKKV